MRLGPLWVLVALGVLIFPLTSSSRTAACGPDLSIVPSASLGPSYSSLISVDAASPSLAWAIGTWRAGGTNSPDRALFERWNGTSWVAIKGRNVGSGDTDLTDVGITSGKSVWAVGSVSSGKASRTLVEHWTPSGVKVVKIPSPGSVSFLTGVAVVSARNIWAVGGKAGHPLIEHWNGKKWAVVPSPGPVESSLREIDALSASNVWAVGAVRKNGVVKTLVEHWNGKAWKLVPSLNRGATSNFLTAVEAISGNNVWAVGYVEGAANSFTNLIEHWNGKTWKVVPSPAGGAYQNFLESVDAVSATDVWAVGNSAAQSTVPYGYKTMVLHWDGSSWTVVPSPSPSPATGYNGLGGVAALKTGQVWAVGDYNAGTKFDTLVLQRCGG